MSGAANPSIALDAVSGVPHPARIIAERAEHRLEFNVMPGRMVTEHLHVRRYEIDGRTISAHFDRSYRSEMLASPSHLIFLSGLVQLQKLAYVWLCDYFGFDYSPQRPEALKIWPFDIKLKLPDLIRPESGLMQTLTVENIYRLSDEAYWFRGTSRVGDALEIAGAVRVLLLQAPGTRP